MSFHKHMAIFILVVSVILAGQSNAQFRVGLLGEPAGAEAEKAYE